MRGIVMAVLGLTLVLNVGPLVDAASADDLLEEGINECTIDFDSVCPDTSPVCRVRARGGAGCVIDGLPFCYDTGSFSFRVDAGDRAQFILRTPVDEIEVFFAQGAAGAGGRMSFFDVNGVQVGLPLQTNGICADEMPATQVISFETPVKRVRVRAIDTDVYIDSLALRRN